MRRIFALALVLSVLTTLLMGAETEKQTPIYFFHGTNCPGCVQVEPTMAKLAKDPSLDVRSFEIYGTRKNYKMMMAFYKAFKAPPKGRAIPVVFIGDEYLIGAGAILNKLTDKIELYKDRDSKESTLADTADTIEKQFTKP